MISRAKHVIPSAVLSFDQEKRKQRKVEAALDSRVV